MLSLDGGSTSIKSFLPSTLNSSSSSLWTSIYSQTAPEAVLQWHTSFLNGGADIITTNTYQIPLLRDLPDGIPPSIVCAAVSLAIRAIEQHGKGSIALSLGTRNAHTGKGEYSNAAQGTIQQYAEFHRTRLLEWHDILGELWNKIEYLAFETISSLEEATAIVVVLRGLEFTFDKKTWISFSCGDGSVSRMQGIFSRLVQMDLSKLWGLGFNCVGIDIVNDLTGMLAGRIQGLNFMMVIYPDAGNWLQRTTAQFATDSPSMDDEYIEKWAECLKKISTLNNGNVVLGGCCNTDPRFISKLKSII